MAAILMASARVIIFLKNQYLSLHLLNIRYILQ